MQTMSQRIVRDDSGLLRFPFDATSWARGMARRNHWCSLCQLLVPSGQMMYRPMRGRHAGARGGYLRLCWCCAHWLIDGCPDEGVSSTLTARTGRLPGWLVGETENT